MRLKKFEIQAIKLTIEKYDKDAQIYLFGSRTDDTKRGGDIDLLIISNKIDKRDIRKIKIELYDLIGEQKIDIISTSKIKGAFIEYAYKSSIKLWLKKKQ